MATVNLGRVGFVNKGDYDNTHTYKLNDVVSYNNSVFSARVAGLLGVTPVDGANWQEWIRNGAYLIDSVNDFVNVPNQFTTVILRDEKRGGVFNHSLTGTPNNGTVFIGAIGYWIRQYTGSVNVKWFGAVGDNVADDTVAIQAAVNVGVAELKNGIFKVTSMITIPDNSGLIGDNSGTIFATGFTNQNPDVHYTTTSLVLNMEGQTVSPYTAGSNKKLIGINIKYNFVNGYVVDAISARNCNDVYIAHNVITDFPLAVGIALASNTKNCIVEGNRIGNFYNSSTFGLTYADRGKVNFYGIIVDDDRVNSLNSNGVVIKDNYIYNIRHGGDALSTFGDQADGIGTQNGTHHIVKNNHVISVNEGIDTYASYQVIDGNILEDNGGWGIKLIHGASHNSVVNNKVKNSGLGGIVVAGGSVADTCYNIVTNNDVNIVDPNNLNSGATTTACINIDNQNVGFNAHNNTFDNNNLYGGTYCKVGILEQNNTLNYSNIFNNNNFIGSFTIGNTTNIIPSKSYFTKRIKSFAWIYQNVAQSIPNGSVWTKVTIDIADTDRQSELDAANKRFTAKYPMIVNVQGSIRFSGTVVAMNLAIRKNGSEVSVQDMTGAIIQMANVNAIIEMSKGDYIELFVKHGSASAVNTTADKVYTKMMICEL